MSEMMLIARREFVERVRTRAFVLGTVIFPLFIAAIMVVPTLLEREGRERTIAVVNEASPTVGATFAALLGTPPEDEKANRYRVEPVAGTAAEQRDRLNARVQAEEIDGYVVIPADVLQRGEVDFRARNVANFGVLSDIRRASSQAVLAGRVQQAGLDPAQVASLFDRVTVREASVTATGEAGGGAQQTFYVAYVIAFLIYFMVAFYGMNVMRSVLEEKTNRISEVLVSSISAVSLMAGKILGVAAAALLQVGIWAVLVVLATTQTGFLTQRMGVPEAMLSQLSVTPSMLGLLILFFTLGFVLFAALFAALGAAMTTEQEAQSLQMVVLIPLFVPMLFLLAIVTEPLGTAATVLGMVPLTAAVAMPMRLAVAQIPVAQVVGSIALLVLSIVVVGWLAGKIYRIGILSTGKKPSMGELMRWLRAA